MKWTRGEDDLGMEPLRGFKQERKQSGLPLRTATWAAKRKVGAGNQGR